MVSCFIRLTGAIPGQVHTPRTRACAPLGEASDAVQYYLGNIRPSRFSITTFEGQCRKGCLGFYCTVIYSSPRNIAIAITIPMPTIEKQTFSATPNPMLKTATPFLNLLKTPPSDLLLRPPRNGLLNMLPIRPKYPLRAHPRRIHRGLARENQRIVEKAAERAAEEWRDHRDPEVVSWVWVRMWMWMECECKCEFLMRRGLL